MLNFRTALRLLLRLLFFIAIVLIANHIIYSWASPPWSWGSDRIHKKRLYLQNDNTGINTLFIGDSKTGQSIIPEMFDRQMQLNGVEGIRSFNFGVGSMMPPESYVTLENLILQDSLPLKLVFIELSNLPMVGPKLIHSLRARYWYTPGYFWFTISALLTGGEKPYALAGKIKSHSISFPEKIFNLGLAKNYWQFRDNRLFEYIDSFRDRGYYSLENSSEAGVYAERIDFLQDTSRLNQNREISLKTEFSELNKVKFSMVHLRKINELIQLSASKGIKLIFLLPPHLGKRSEFVVPLFYRIPAENRLELSDARKFPELYESKYLFEGKHMNHRGAMLFTRLLAREYYKSIKQ